MAKEETMITSLSRVKGLRGRATMLLAASGVAAATAVLGAGSAGAASAGGHGVPTGGSVKTARIAGATVLSSTKGFTLYSFARDTSTKSNCNGPCTANWPPVKGPVTGHGIKGTFGTIKRSNGSTQATFDGHPLYTFVGDTSPGQANGNGINAFGGMWHEITSSGRAAPAHASTSPSSGGYGY
jgi:predicted lipoprotein with Yx(FWY)xxD motif